MTNIFNRASISILTRVYIILFLLPLISIVLGIFAFLTINKSLTNYNNRLLQSYINNVLYADKPNDSYINPSDYKWSNKLLSPHFATAEYNKQVWHNGEMVGPFKIIDVDYNKYSDPKYINIKVYDQQIVVYGQKPEADWKEYLDELPKDLQIGISRIENIEKPLIIMEYPPAILGPIGMNISIFTRIFINDVDGNLPTFIILLYYIPLAISFFVSYVIFKIFKRENIALLFGLALFFSMNFAVQVGLSALLI